MFMAGYAVGHARSMEMVEVPLVVGDLHTMEIIRFLEDPQLDHAIFKLGQWIGEKKGLSRMLSTFWAKTIHLSLAGLSGTLILGPVLGAILYALL